MSGIARVAHVQAKRLMRHIRASSRTENLCRDGQRWDCWNGRVRRANALTRKARKAADLKRICRARAINIARIVAARRQTNRTQIHLKSRACAVARKLGPDWQRQRIVETTCLHAELSSLNNGTSRASVLNDETERIARVLLKRHCRASSSTRARGGKFHRVLLLLRRNNRRRASSSRARRVTADDETVEHKSRDGRSGNIANTGRGEVVLSPENFFNLRRLRVDHTCSCAILLRAMRDAELVRCIANNSERLARV